MTRRFPNCVREMGAPSTCSKRSTTSSCSPSSGPSGSAARGVGAVEGVPPRRRGQPRVRLVDRRIALAQLRLVGAALAEEVADEDEIADVPKIVLERVLRKGSPAGGAGGVGNAHARLLRLGFERSILIPGEAGLRRACEVRENRLAVTGRPRGAPASLAAGEREAVGALRRLVRRVQPIPAPRMA